MGEGASAKPNQIRARHASRRRDPVAGEDFKAGILRVRGWLNCENARPSTFRYWLSEPDSVLRVNFEFEEQAQAFAQAFGGVVLV
jgi:hypothetical protein